MAKKFYAVRKGKKPGIYESWAECQKQVDGFPGAEHKSFTTLNEANAYINNEEQQETIDQKIKDTEVVAYVDGSHNSETEKDATKNKSVYIDQSELKSKIISIGKKHWKIFEASDLTVAGNATRCEIFADGKNAILNFYFKKDGTTTIIPIGKNSKISSTIKALLEEGCEFNNSLMAKSYSFKNIPQEWVSKLVEYLTLLEGVKVEHRKVETHPVHDCYQFTSKIGDKLTVNIYKTGTLTIQGKPAYLYGEAISLLSHCDDVSMDDIVDTVNTFHSIDVKTKDVRDELKVLLPRSYDNIDDMVLKLLSPSISLRKVKIELEDYSCCAFPALRALEGYIKYLFKTKNVTVGNTFHKIYKGDALAPHIAIKIGDASCQTELERLYNYFKGNRHVLFHAEQILIGTTILEDKLESDLIINNVLNLIETSYTNINR